MALTSASGIATYVYNSFNSIPTGVSGNMVETVEQAINHVANYTGDTVGTSSIDPKYVPAIIDLVKADTIDSIQSQSGGESVSLAELSINESGEAASAEAYRKSADAKLAALGQGRKYGKVLA